MITIEQCRAARGLLDWTQQDLANNAGLSKTAINNFEKGYSDIKRESLEAIRSAFESANIEFIERIGVRIKSETAKILKGATAFHQLLDDIEQSIEQPSEKNHEILISHLDGKFTSFYGQNRINELLENCNMRHIRVRVLGHDEILPGTVNFRSLPPDAAKSGSITFLYGQKTALLFGGHSVIVLIDCPDAAAAQRQYFEDLWNTSLPPASHSSRKRQAGT